MTYYAVRSGRETGIFNSWKECEEKVKGYSGAEYKKFKSLKEAEDFLKGEETNKNIYDIKNLKEKEAVVYVDGSFDIETFTYSYGIVFLTKDKKTTLSGRDNKEDLKEMRNVSGELKASMVAMEKAIAMGLDKIYLHYDYAGIEKWAKGEWKRNKKGTVLYKEFYDEISKKLKVEFIKVDAHTGIKYNEEADKLAKEAL